MSPDVRIFPDLSLYEKRLDLIEAGISGIDDVRIIMGLATCEHKYNVVDRRAISSVEEVSFDEQRGQIDVDAFAFNLDFEYGIHKSPENVFVLTDRDLFAEKCQFVIGRTIRDKNLSIQSVYRFIKATNDESLQKESIRYIARHNYAHLAGLKRSEDFENPNVINGIANGHCSDGYCTMRQALSVDEILRLVESPVYQDNMAGFCMNCVKGLIKKSE